jgi:hypothetical protein
LEEVGRRPKITGAERREISIPREMFLSELGFTGLKGLINILLIPIQTLWPQQMMI